MATGHLSSFLRRLHRAAPPPDGLTDGQLLECFVGRRDEAAFETLVRRHGPMVWGVCRRVLRSEADAEDAFQATFLVLVRKAASIADRAAVGNWLYGVAHNTALKAKSMNDRRRAKERRSAEVGRPQAPEELWRQLLPLLDEELSRLPDKYRAPLVLCELEGRTVKEAARQLGCPQGTAASRLARGRVLLAKRLARHGLALSGGALAAVLSRNAASAAAPAPLVTSTVKAAALFAAGRAATAGVISAKVVALTEGALKSMFLSKLKWAAVLLLVLGACGMGVGAFARLAGAAERGGPRQGATGEGKAEAPKQDAPEGDAAKEAEQQKEKEAAKLKGKWKAVAVEIAGQALPEDAAKATVWEIADGKVTTKQLPNIKGGAEQEVVPFKIDPTKDPAHIDFEGEVDGKKTVLKGIYKLDRDELTVCLIGADGGRPSEFGSSDLRNGEKGGNMLMKFKREKEDKEDPGKK
jgi:RNA polymerase sigma-70 factor (ECF subfamily)